VHQCLREGRKESPLMTLAESRTILSTMDALRGQWGLRYPFE